MTNAARLTRSAPMMAVGFLWAMGATTVAAEAAGATLGLVIGGLFVTALLTPILTAAGKGVSGRLAITLAIVVGISGVWLCLIGPSRASFWQWMMVSMVLMSLSIALAGLVAVLEAVGCAPLPAAAIAVAAVLAWLTWPIWLSPSLAAGQWAGAVKYLVVLHPPLVANGVLTFTAPWTEQAIAYRLTVLDQDVPVRLPASPWTCIAAHLILGAALLGVAGRRAFRSAQSPE